MINEKDWLLTLPIAHRGLHNEKFPENSFGAFQNAIDHGYPIETDVHITADGHLIIFHDDSLKRVTGDPRDTESLTLAEIKSLKLLSTGYGIPTMDEFLEFVSGKVPLMIEIKNARKVGALEKKLADTLRNYKGEFALQSFNPHSIAYFSRNAPEMTRGLLSCEYKDTDLAFYKKFVLRRLWLLKKSGAQFINYKWDELPQNKVSKTGLPVLGWTVRSQSEYERSKSVAKNVIFENFLPR